MNYTNEQIKDLIPDFIEHGEGVEELINESEWIDIMSEAAIRFHVFLLIKKGYGQMHELWLAHRAKMEEENEPTV